MFHKGKEGYAKTLVVKECFKWLLMSRTEQFWAGKIFKISCVTAK